MQAEEKPAAGEESRQRYPPIAFLVVLTWYSLILLNIVFWCKFIMGMVGRIFFCFRCFLLAFRAFRLVLWRLFLFFFKAGKTDALRSILRMFRASLSSLKKLESTIAIKISVNYCLLQLKWFFPKKKKKHNVI